MANAPPARARSPPPLLRRPQPSPKPIPLQGHLLRPIPQGHSLHEENGLLPASRTPISNPQAPGAAKEASEERGRLSLQPTTTDGQRVEDSGQYLYRPSSNSSNNNSLQPPSRSQVSTTSTVVSTRVVGAIAAGTGELPTGWIQKLSSKGRVYFVDNSTGTATWDDPRGKQLLLSPTIHDEATQLLNPGAGARDRSAHSRSRSRSAQRLPGVKSAPIIRKVLSLDGGGVRGLSTIIILKHIMKILNKKRGFDVHPWQEFDMIGGTSTGGLLAIMLGRLRMPLDECEQKYLQMSAKIFTPARGKGNLAGRTFDFLQANGKFQSKPLEEAIQEILAAEGLSADTLLMDDDPESCKVFVCATQAENSSTVVIRSYETDQYDSLADIVQIWEAARATSAASTFFNPITIGPYDQQFVDGALRHNNPINLVDLESTQIWPQQDRIIISIGTGSAPGEDLLGNLKDLAKQLAKIATDTEEENELFRRRNQAMIEHQRLYRFNVLEGLSDVGLEEYEAKARIGAHTAHYLGRFDTQRDVTACANTLSEGAQRLDYVGGEDLTAHFAKLAVTDVMCVVCPHCLKGIPYSTNFYRCRKCMIYVCQRCHSRHYWNHHQYFARCKAIQWEAIMPGLEPERVCGHCSQTRKDRVECRNCLANLCYSCWRNDDRRPIWEKKHYREHPDHKELTLALPKNHFMLKSYKDSCPCIDDPSCLVHCERCLEPVRIGESFYHCRDCDFGYGFTQDICLNCLNADRAHHSANHRVDSCIFRKTLSSSYDLKQSFDQAKQCREPECGQLISLFDQGSHHHLRSRLIVGTLLTEQMHSTAVRMCPRLQLRRTFPQSPNPTKIVCFFCHNFLPFYNNKALSICITPGCFQGFCDHCTEANRQNHRHPLVAFACIKRDAAAPSLDFRMVTCNTCQNQYFAKLYIGMECYVCKNWHICNDCVVRGTMPKKHGSCKANAWRSFRDQ